MQLAEFLIIINWIMTKLRTYVDSLADFGGKIFVQLQWQISEICRAHDLQEQDILSRCVLFTHCTNLLL